jgi:Spy/CpxP family protein refolding chaperone
MFQRVSSQEATMLRIRIVTLALGLFAAMPAVAQQQHGDSAARAAQVKERLAKISKELNLTPQQNEQLKPIIQQEVADLRAVHDKYKGDKSSDAKMSRRKEMRAVQEKYEPQINGVLTPDQQAQWKKMKQEKMEQMKKHKKPA